MIVVQDLFTKYIELFSMRNQTIKIIVKTSEIVFDRWGANPESIITDNGTEYINKEVEAFLIARKVNRITIPLKHP